MWLFTKIGFYSVVQHKDDKDKLLVRTRDRNHMRAICKLLAGLPKVIEMPETEADYQFRIIVGRAEWREVVAFLAAEDVDYVNFKDAVPFGRYHTKLINVWFTMKGVLLGKQRDTRRKML